MGIRRIGKMDGPAEQKAEEDLLARAIEARDGDLRAFEQLVEQHQKRILADCRFMTRDESSAEDLAQEVFVKAYFGLRSFEGRSSFQHWLQRIKVNHCINHIKKRQARQQISIDGEIGEDSDLLQVPPDAYRNFEAMDDRSRIEAILDSLPASLRLPLILREMDELSYEEIAEKLNIGLSAAKMRTKRAREEFRRRYEVLNRPKARSA